MNNFKNVRQSLTPFVFPSPLSYYCVCVCVYFASKLPFTEEQLQTINKAQEDEAREDKPCAKLSDEVMSDEDSGSEVKDNREDSDASAPMSDDSESVSDDDDTYSVIAPTPMNSSESAEAAEEWMNVAQLLQDQELICKHCNKRSSNIITVTPSCCGRSYKTHALCAAQKLSTALDSNNVAAAFGCFQGDEACLKKLTSLMKFNWKSSSPQMSCVYDDVIARNYYRTTKEFNSDESVCQVCETDLTHMNIKKLKKHVLECTELFHEIKRCKCAKRCDDI